MVRSLYSVDKSHLVANLAYRLGLENPDMYVEIGNGNPEADLLIVQSSIKIPEADAVVGALKKFNLLDNTYRATIHIVEEKSNRQNLLELIGIIQPLIVVACGKEAARFLGKKTGKKIKINELPTLPCYGIMDPNDYGHSGAPPSLKKKGKEEWSHLTTTLLAEKKKYYDQ